MKTVFSPAHQTCRGDFNIREERRERDRERDLCMTVVQTLTHPVTWRREEDGAGQEALGYLSSRTASTFQGWEEIRVGAPDPMAKERPCPRCGSRRRLRRSGRWQHCLCRDAI